MSHSGFKPNNQLFSASCSPPLACPDHEPRVTPQVCFGVGGRRRYKKNETPLQTFQSGNKNSNNSTGSQFQFPPTGPRLQLENNPTIRGAARRRRRRRRGRGHRSSANRRRDRDGSGRTRHRQRSTCTHRSTTHRSAAQSSSRRSSCGSRSTSSGGDGSGSGRVH